MADDVDAQTRTPLPASLPFSLNLLSTHPQTGHLSHAACDHHTRNVATVFAPRIFLFKRSTSVPDPPAPATRQTAQTARHQTTRQPQPPLPCVLPAPDQLGRFQPPPAAAHPGGAQRPAPTLPMLLSAPPPPVRTLPRCPCAGRPPQCAPHYRLSADQGAAQHNQ